MLEKLIQYGASAAISAIVALITLFIKRKWDKDDSEEVEHREVMNKLDALGTKLDAHIAADQQEKIEEKRLKVIEFSDDLIHAEATGVRYSKERFDRILELVDEYEKFCAENEKYPNSKAEMAIQNVKKVYQSCQENHTFLA